MRRPIARVAATTSPGVVGAVGAVGSIGFLAARCWLHRLSGLVDEHARYWGERAGVDGDLLYVALGDSLTQGLTARSPAHGYVGRLADLLEARHPGRQVRVVNLSVCGASVSDLVRDQLPRLAELPAADLVTVCIGTNDVGRTPPSRFEASWRELCRRLPPAALVADVPAAPFGRDKHPASAAARTCRRVLEDFPHLLPVGLHEATSALRPWHLGRDLLHPGSRGHRRYAAAFELALDRPRATRAAARQPEPAPRPV